MLNLKSAGLAAAGALVGVLAAVSAGAQVSGTDDSNAPKLAVQYRASQLDSDQGVHRLYVRLIKAAERVCPQTTGTLLNPAVEACRQKALAGAVAQIHSARLAALSARALKAG